MLQDRAAGPPAARPYARAVPRPLRERAHPAHAEPDERYYVRRDDVNDSNGNGNGTSFPAAVDYDAVAILMYRDNAHFDANWAFFEDPETSKIIAADGAEFSGWTKGVFLQ
ncbi:HypE protein [Apiospora hydei]|uniref:HypE protein n=1 Tax=Apiospora hydei TaxID=1337664 RepID=A0ABR1WNU9_9PEZI